MKLGKIETHIVTGVYIYAFLTYTCTTIHPFLVSRSERTQMKCTLAYYDDATFMVWVHGLKIHTNIPTAETAGTKVNKKLTKYDFTNIKKMSTLLVQLVLIVLYI